MKIQKKIAVPINLIRNNIALPCKTSVVKGFKSSFGEFFTEYTQRMTHVNESDIKIYVACLNVILSKMEIVANQEEFLSGVIQNGYTIKVSEIRKYRGLTKTKSAYDTILSALLKLKKVTITSENFWLNATKSHKSVSDKAIYCYSLIEEVIYTKEENAKVHVKFNKFMVMALREKDGYYPVYVDRKIFNSLKGVNFNLYIYLCSQMLGKVNVKKFELETLIKNTNLHFFSTVKNNKREAKRKLKTALKKLKELGFICKFSQEENAKGKTIYLVVKKLKEKVNNC